MKQARNNPNMRRNIVHVLQNDGADLGNNNKRRFPRFSRHSKCAYNSPKSNLVYINEPSTSSAYIDYVANLNGGNTKNPAANECRTDKVCFQIWDDNMMAQAQGRSKKKNEKGTKKSKRVLRWMSMIFSSKR